MVDYLLSGVKFFETACGKIKSSKDMSLTKKQMPSYPLPPVNRRHQYPAVFALDNGYGQVHPPPPTNLYEAAAYRNTDQSSIDIPGLYTEVDRLDQYPAPQEYKPQTKPGELFRYKVSPHLILDKTNYRFN